MSAIRTGRREEGASTTRTELKVVPRRKGKGLIKRSGTRRFAPLTILATIAIGAVVAAVLLEQVVLAQSAFKLTEIRNELTQAEENREVLMLEAAKLDSAARIERYARETLGMTEPEPQNVRYIVADIPARRDDGLSVAGQPYRAPRDAAAAASALSVGDAP